MAREHADLAGGARHDQHLRVSPEGIALGSDDRNVELGMRVGHYAAAGSAVRSALATAPSIVPTM